MSDFGGFDSIKLSVMLCNDEFTRKLNEEWRLQHVSGTFQFLCWGDVVISAETAA